MAAVPFLPKNAPFTAEDINILNELVARSTPLQRSWLSGFLAGLDAAQAQGSGAQPAAQQRARVPMTILYASESGNCESLAMKAKKVAQKNNFDAKVFDMADVDPSILTKTKYLVVYAATWGEGDPPERAADFYNALMSDDAPKLDGVTFAVLALGDTSYVNFCETGRKIDERLEQLGGKRGVDRIELDLDFSKQAADWTAASLAKLAPAEAPNTVVHVDFSAQPQDEFTEPEFDADNPLQVEISSLVNLNGTGSTRETWHVEMELDNPAFVYNPGDAIGVLPDNDPEVVNELLDAVGLSGDTGLAQRLTNEFDITALSRPVTAAYAKLTGRKDVAKVSEGDAFLKYSEDRQLVDLFVDHPEKLKPDQLLGLLRPLPGRLYSVASSPLAHEGEVHLTVGAVRWSREGKQRRGVTSTYFADRRKVGDSARIYVKPNRHFRLPKDGDQKIIMIGAGTGIAPYRGFVAQREAEGASGESWLFFGERNFTNDFLYQLEWQEALENGSLSRIDVAFSRAQPEKIYVQHRLWEQRADVLGWIKDGAHLYVCGDEKGMAKDVDATLVKILAEDEKGDLEAGRAKLKDLSKAGRYQRDVY